MNNKFNIYMIIILYFFALIFPYKYATYLYYPWLCMILIIINFNIARKHNKLCIKINYGIFIFIIFMLSTIVSTLLGNQLNILKNTILLLSIYSIFFITYMILNFSGEKFFEKFYRFVMVIGNCLAIYGLIEMSIKKFFLSKYFNEGSLVKQYEYLNGTYSYRQHSIFEHYIIFGVFLICLLWINIFLAKKNLSKYIMIIIILINIFQTKARSAWIVMVITLIIYVIIFLRKKIIQQLNISYFKILIGIFVAFVLYYIFSDYFNNLFFSIINRFNDMNTSLGSVSKTQRLGTIEIVVNSILKSNIFNILFGYGFRSADNFMLNNIVTIQGFKTTDNQYASFLYDFGIIGLTLFSILLIMIFKMHINNLKKKCKNVNKIAFFIVITICISMFFYEAFRFKSLFVLLFISITIILFDENSKEKFYEN